MMTDFTTTPPTFRMSESQKTKFFDLLKPMPIDGGDHVYDLLALAELTRNLMRFLAISYDNRADPAKPIKTLTEISDEERRLYYPFAFMLACLDGNAFRSGELEMMTENWRSGSGAMETVTQYIPDAMRLIAANGGDLDEVKKIITTANG